MQNDERRIAVFIDFENVAMGVRESKYGNFNIELVLKRLVEKGKIMVKRAYSDWHRYAEFKRAFHQAAIELIDVPQTRYSGKNSAAGYGYSDRPAGKLWTAPAQAQLLRRAFAELGLERPVVVGHSWGTLVALALALDHPDAVGGLVLMSGYYKPTARLDVPLAALAAVPLLGDILRHTISPLFGAAMLLLNVKAMFSPQAVPNRFHNKFAYGFPVRPSQIRAESQDAATMVPGAAALSRRYDELKLPITIMAGVDDRIADVDNQSAWFHDAVPGSELILMPDAGHMVHYAVPGQVADTIDEVARQAQVTKKVSAGNRPVVELGQRPAA